MNYSKSNLTAKLKSNLALRKVILLFAFIVLSCSKDAVETTPPAVTKFQVTVASQDDSKGSVSTTGGSFESGSDVTITATPKDGFQFTGWTGGASGDANPLTIKVSENANITATFDVIKYTLNVNVIGNGTVTQQSSSTTTTEEYNAGDVVRLSAAADDGWLFYTWSGSSTGTTNALDITIDSSKTITATFEEKIVDIVANGLSDIIGEWIIRTPNTEARGDNYLQCQMTKVTFRTDGTFTLTFNNLVAINGRFNLQRGADASFGVFLTVGTLNYGTLKSLTLTRNYISFVFQSSECTESKLVAGDRNKGYVESEDPNTTPPVSGVCKVSTSLVDGPQTQTVTQTNAIKTVSYSFSTTCSDSLTASASGLPTGVTMSFSNNKAVVSGTPSAAISGTYNYAITAKSSSASTTIAGVIIVNERCKILGSLSSGPQSQTVTESTAISTVTYTFKECSNPLSASVTGLPAGVTMNFSNNQAVISGTPTTKAGGSFNYAITVTDNNVASTTISGSIKVNSVCPISGTLTSGSQSQTATQTSDISAVTYTFTSACGRTLTATATGLPAGVTMNFSNNKAVVSGVPLTSNTPGTYNYSITVQDSSNVATTVTGSVIVTLLPLPPCSISGALSNGPSSQTVTQTNNITPVTHSFSACFGALTTRAIDLPPGVTMSFNALFNQAVISGAPNRTAAGTYNYSIIANDSSGTTTVTGRIDIIACAVTGNRTTGAQTQTATQSLAITPITYRFNSICNLPLTHTLTGSLPTGLTSSFNNNQFVISGTPTTAAAGRLYNYSVAVTDGVTSTTVAGAIDLIACTVTGNRTTGAQTQIATQTLAITPVVYTFNSNCGKSLTVTNSNLPTGVTATLAGNRVTVSGTPLITAAPRVYNYGITVSDGATSTTLTGAIQLVPCAIRWGLSPTSAGMQTQVATPTLAISTITYNLSSDCGSTFTISSTMGLPTGVSSRILGNTLTISGVPSANMAGSYDYRVTVSNGTTSTIVTGRITVNAACMVTGMITSNQTINATQTLAINTTLNHSLRSNCGKTLTVSSTNGLPAGVTVGALTGTTLAISGTPSITVAARTYNYNIVVSDGVTGTTLTGAINLNTCAVRWGLSPTSTGMQTQVATPTIAIPTITYNLSSDCGSTFTISSTMGLPTGVSANILGNALTISGVPSSANMAGAYNYRVTVSNGTTSTIVTGVINLIACRVTGMLTSGAQTQTATRTLAITPAVYTFNSSCARTLTATNTGLPTGVTAALTGNRVTVSGTPPTTAATGTYNYRLTVSDGVTGTTVNGVINLNACGIRGRLSTTSAIAQTAVVTRASVVQTTYDFDFNCNSSPSPRPLTFVSLNGPSWITTSTIPAANTLPSNQPRGFFSVVLQAAPVGSTPVGNYPYTITVTDGVKPISVTGTIVVIVPCTSAPTLISSLTSGTGSTTQVINRGFPMIPTEFAISASCGPPPVSSTLTATIYMGRVAPRGITPSFTADGKLRVSGTIDANANFGRYIYIYEITGAGFNPVTVTGNIEALR